MKEQDDSLLGTAASGKSTRPPMPRRDNEPLRFEITNGALVFSIGIDVLAHAFHASPVRDRLIWDESKFDYDQSRCRVVDAPEFAKDVKLAMLREREDGSSPLTDLIDKACESAVGDGSLGISDDGDEA